MTKRIQFTRKELDTMQSLCLIAEAFGQNEGDYQDTDFEAVNSACDKIGLLLDRKPPKDKAA